MGIEKILPDVSALAGPQAVKRCAERYRQSREVAEQFSSVMVSNLVKEMFKTVSTDGESPFGSGPGADVYQGMAETAFADALVKNGMKDLTDTIHEHILRLARNHQEEQP